MSETNKQLVKQAYELFGAGDLPGMLELFADDIEWTVPTIENISFVGPRSGKTSVAEFFPQLLASEEFHEFVPMEFIAEGNKVVVLGKSAVTVRSTGRPYSTEWCHVFTIRDGKIAAFLEFLDTAVASRAFQKAASA